MQQKEQTGELYSGTIAWSAPQTVFCMREIFQHADFPIAMVSTRVFGAARREGWKIVRKSGWCAAPGCLRHVERLMLSAHFADD